jgi:hypothetical protein
MAVTMAVATAVAIQACPFVENGSVPYRRALLSSFQRVATSSASSFTAFCTLTIPM